MLDVALAGRAELLVTANMRDFTSYRTVTIKPDRLTIQTTATHRLTVVHPFELADWIRVGAIPDMPETAQR